MAAAKRQASETKAMRLVLRHHLRTEDRPHWCQDLWAPRDIEVETALRLVELGGYARDGVSVDGIVGLASWGLVEWLPRKGWTLQSAVLADYLHEVRA